MPKVVIAAILLLTSATAFAFYDQPAFTYEGAYDYFIISKSLLADNQAQSYEDGVHQGDTSLGIAGTTAVLGSEDIPPDAVVEKAMLLWVVSKDDADKNAFGDNTVTLITPDGTEHEVAATQAGNSASPDTLEFESHWESGYYYYLYRVDVTDIMKLYQEGDPDSPDQLSLTGDYTVKGVDDIYDCIADSNHAYCSSASMVGGWQLILIYGSKQIARKRLYFYYGMEWSSGTTFNPLTIHITGFELPDQAAVKLSVVTSDGDDVDSAKEFLRIKGNLTANNPLILADQCNPPDLPFNNKYLNYNYKKEPTAECIVEFSLDVDTFLLQYDPNDTQGLINEHIKYGTTAFDFQIGTGSDILLTNYMMMSVDTKLPAFDIPAMDEKYLLTNSQSPDNICHDRVSAYEIWVENHGQETASMVMVQDTMPAGLKYIAGSTQIDRTGTGTCYEPVDDVNGESPLFGGMLVADTLDICQDEVNCPRILLRFKIQPQEGLPKNTSFKNTARIWDAVVGEAAAYLSNQGLPLRSFFDQSCPDTVTDPYPPDTTCGEIPVTDDDQTNDDDATIPDGAVDTGSGDSGGESPDDDGLLFEEENGCGCSLVM
ncbi:MAG TPA: hypothetical protein PLV42_12045 [bacterium]|nr:hypothetical protein [bacterium]